VKVPFSACLFPNKKRGVFFWLARTGAKSSLL
jgi:hypothetical protein